MAMTARPVVLRVSNLCKYYSASSGLAARLLGRNDYIRAVDGVNLNLQEGATMGIVGESGSGKSTLVETILRLEEPTSGEVFFQDSSVTAFDTEELRRFRENAQIIFQDPYETLNPMKTVFQSVSEPLRNFRDYDYATLEDEVDSMLYDVGLRPPDEYREKYPGQLSGGERQRVNIARSVILEPDLLIADEPLSMLDVSIQSGIIKMLNRLQTDIGFSMLYVSHNLSVVRLICDDIAVMYSGKIVERGTAKQIMTDPKHPYTRALVSSLPTLSQNRERVLLERRADDEAGTPQGCRFHPRCPDKMDRCTLAEPLLVEAEGREVACYLHHEESA